MDTATFRQRLQQLRQDEGKAVSKSQRHLAGAALDFKRHGGPTFAAAEKMAAGMNVEQLRDMAGVREKGLPKHVRPKKGGGKGKCHEGARPGVFDAEGNVKGFAQWAAEASRMDESDGPENPGGGDADNDGGDDDAMIPDGLTRDDALVVALQELGLHTGSEMDPEKDRDAIAAALPVKLDLVRDKLKSSSRIQEMGRSNPLVQRVLADKNATVQDLVIAMSADEDGGGGDRGPRPDPTAMGQEGDSRPDSDVESDEEGPFSPL